MISLDEKLGTAVAKLKPSSRKKYQERTRGERLSQETLINIAESLVAEDGAVEVRESRSIRRNNGSAREAGQNTEADFRAESDAILMEALSKRDPRLKAATEVSENGRLTESQKQDYDFAVAIGLSESEALKVALSNFIKG